MGIEKILQAGNKLQLALAEDIMYEELAGYNCSKKREVLYEWYEALKEYKEHTKKEKENAN